MFIVYHGAIRIAHRRCVYVQKMYQQRNIYTTNEVAVEVAHADFIRLHCLSLSRSR